MPAPSQAVNSFVLPVPPAASFQYGSAVIDPGAPGGDAFSLPVVALAYSTVRAVGGNGVSVFSMATPSGVIAGSARTYRMRGKLVSAPHSTVQWDSLNASDPTGSLAPGPVTNVVVLRITQG